VVKGKAVFSALSQGKKRLTGAGMTEKVVWLHLLARKSVLLPAIDDYEF
jgi:hypothetical protein